MGPLVVDVVVFVLFCVLTVVQFATRRGSRFAGVIYLSVAVLMLAQIVDQPPLDRLLPPAWQFDISVGLGVLAFLIFFLGGILATNIRRRQPQ